MPPIPRCPLRTWRGETPEEAPDPWSTELLALPEGWDPKSRAVPIRFTVPLTQLEAGTYDCQVTVLDPGAGRAAFWHAPIAVRR
jgi:hypothetical protein